jgi:ribonuclease HI
MSINRPPGRNRRSYHMNEVYVLAELSSESNSKNATYSINLVHESTSKMFLVHFRPTAKNRMDLMALIAALETLKVPSHVDLYSKSQYLFDSINNASAMKWQRCNWLMRGGCRVPNSDLWEKYLQVASIHKIEVQLLR